MAEIVINANDGRVQYTASGGQTVFAYDFPVFDEDHIVVERVRSGTLTTLVLTTDYTVSGVGVVSGGNVTLVSGATAGDTITIYRDVPIERTSDFTEAGDFRAETINRELDLLVMMLQEQARDIGRAIHIPPEDTATDMELPSVDDRKGRFLFFNATTGNVDVANTVGIWQDTWATATAYNVGDIVKDGAAGADTHHVYYCLVAHTSGTWATDLAAAKWTLLVERGETGATGPAAASASETVEGIAELATDAEALAGTDTARIVPTAKIGGWIGRALEPGGRLTLTTALPVTTSDVTAAGTVYYAPYKHNLAPIWNGTRWQVYSFSELSLVLEAAQQLSGANHDMFLFDLAGALTLGTGPAWTNATTRADALGRKDGRWTNSASITIRTNGANNTVAANKALYVGTIRMTANAQTEDSKAKRFLWNTYNRVVRQMRAATETTDTWDYATATWRQANANAANQLMFLRGLDEDAVSATAVGICGNSNSETTLTGIGLDATNAIAADSYPGSQQGATAEQEYGMVAQYRGLPGIGYHYLAWLEYADAGAATASWKGDSGAPTVYQSGIHGELLA